MVRKLAYTALVFLIFLLLAEVAARLVESRVPADDASNSRTGWQSEFFGSLFDWHEPDPDLLWRFRPNLDNPLIKTNADRLIGDEIAPKKPGNTLRILLLGDSSPVGLGLDSYRRTFGSVTERMLDLAFADKRSVELLNAAVTGYSSEQIKRLLPARGWNLDPDLVVVYCGNNDASISGMCRDRQLLEGQQLRWLRRLLGHLALYRVMRSLLASDRADAGQATEELQVRVSPEEYEENLREIARQCDAHGCPLILLSPPVPHLWPAGLQFKSFAHVTAKDGHIIMPPEISSVVGRKLKYCLDRELFSDLYGRGDVFTRAVYASAYDDSLPPEQAVELYSTALRGRPGDPVLLNNLGVSLWQAGRFDDAEQVLKEARTRYNHVYAAPRSPAVDAAGSPILYNIGIGLLRDSEDWQGLLADTTTVAYAYLDSALQADYLSLRIKSDYTRGLRRVGEMDGVTVIDLPTLFAREGGEGLFVDHCHPTAEGHLIIARELARVIADLTMP